MRTRIAAVALAILLGGAGCDGMIQGADNNPTRTAKKAASKAALTPPGLDPVVAPTERTYLGFDGVDLAASRVVAPAGTDRDRIKPYSALMGDYPRILGNAPGLLDTMAATFADPGPRWYQETKANAVSVYSAYRIAFEGCLTLTGSGATYAAAPTAASATAACTAWQTAFWSRVPATGEVSTCANFATQGTTTETNPRRQWAYTCAAVATAGQFLTF